MQAEALAEAIANGDLARYQAAHKRIMWRPALLSRLLLTLDGRPRLRNRVMHILSSDPQLFARWLAMHAGAATGAESALGGLRLGWRLVTN